MSEFLIDKYIGQIKTIVDWMGVDPDNCTLRFNKEFNVFNVLGPYGKVLTLSFSIQELKIVGIKVEYFVSDFSCSLKNYEYVDVKQTFSKEEQYAILEIEKLFKHNDYCHDYSYFKLCYACNYEYCDIIRFYDNNNKQIQYIEVEESNELSKLQPFFFFKDHLCTDNIEYLIEKEKHRIAQLEYQIIGSMNVIEELKLKQKYRK